MTDSVLLNLSQVLLLHNSKVYMEARSSFGPFADPEAVSRLLQAVVLVTAALPDPNCLLRLLELLVHCAEDSVAVSALSPVAAPLFDIVCLQVRLPDTVDEETYLAFHDAVVSRRTSVNLSQEMEDCLTVLFELR